jgi:ADP-ribose pyrophosphatase YjhB (NUDIX family)
VCSRPFWRIILPPIAPFCRRAISRDTTAIACRTGAPADFALDRFYVSARAVTLQDDKLLLVRNKKSDWWYGAGGGIELAEDVFAAAQREVQEETGLVVHATHVVAVDEFYSHTARIHQINIYTACQPVGPQELAPEWVDPAGYVGEARFFSADEFRQHPRRFHHTYSTLHGHI